MPRGGVPLRAAFRFGGQELWVRCRRSMDDKPPPARRLELKPKDIIPSDSASRPGDGTEISVPLMLRENRLAEARAAGARPLGPEPGPPEPASPRARPRPSGPRRSRR